MSSNIENPNTTLRDSSGTELGTSGNPVRVNPTGTTTQPVSASSLPLPTGAATQTTLAALLANTAPLGQAAMAASMPVVISSNQSVIPINDNGGSLTVDGAVAATQSGTWNITNISGTVSLPAGAATETTLATLLTTSAFQARINTLGQKTSANSTPVVLSSDQSAISVTGTVTAVNASVGTTNTVFPSSATYVGGSDGTNLQGARVFDLDSGAGSQYILGVGLRLAASGGSVEAGTSANPIRTDPTGTTTQPVSGTVTANAGTGTFAVSAASLPLPSGAATSALQTTGNSSLSSIDTKTPSVGQATMAASSPVVIASNQSSIPVTGTFFQTTQPVSIAASVAVTGPLTDTQLRATPVPVSGTVTAANASVSTTGSAPPASATYAGGSVTTASPTYTTGQMNALSLTTAGALRVDASSTTQPVSGTVTANQGGTWNVTNISGTVSLPTGASTSSLQTTGNSSLSSIDTKTPSLGQAVMASSVPIVIASNQSTLAVTGTFFQATQPVSGTVAATQSGTWTVQPGNTANTTPWLSSIAQGGNTAAVKAASTAPVAADQALVVSISPNSSLTATNPSVSTTGTAPPASATLGGASVTTAAPSYTTGQMSALSLTTAGGLRVDGSATTQPVSGTITANQGGTWNVTNISGTVSLPTGAATSALQTTGNSSLSSIDGKTPALGQATMAASQPVAIASNQSSIPVTGTFFQTTQPVSAASLPLPTGAATETSLAKLTVTQSTALGSNTLAMVGGSVTTAAPAYTTGNINPLSLDLNGALRVNVYDNPLTYSAATAGIASAATPTDIFTITGSATMTIRILKIRVSGTKTTAGTADVLLIRRSTANTAGTSTTMTNVSHDTNNTAATAVVRAYTANPTLGTSVGAFRSAKVFLAAPATASAGAVMEYEFGTRGNQAIVLRGTSQVIAVNLNSVTQTGGSFNVSIEWTEEP